MRITRGQRISGQEAVALRGALRHVGGRPFSAQEVGLRLGTPEVGTAALVAALAAKGLVEEAEGSEADPWYWLTVARQPAGQRDRAAPGEQGSGTP